MNLVSMIGYGVDLRGFALFATTKLKQSVFGDSWSGRSDCCLSFMGFFLFAV